MLKGLTAIPQPCISKIWIESTKQKSFKQSSWADLYYNKDDSLAPEVDASNMVQITFKMSLKSLYPQASPVGGNPVCDILVGEKIKNILID